MKRLLLFIIIAAFCLSYQVNDVFASPTKGIHLLFPEEIERLAKPQMNLKPGSFVVVPISQDDWRHLDKWQRFMFWAKKLKLKPMLRLTTRPMPAGYWQRPTLVSAIDWANFLSLLNWPKGERWVIIFNEPNHASEWGGDINPDEYSRILAEYSLKLHAKDSHFKVLAAALDMAAGRTSTTWSAKNYWLAVWHNLPEFYNLVDGWNSHAYPNPAFSAPPSKYKVNNIASYNFELRWFEDYFHHRWQKEIFITESGWSKHYLKKRRICDYLSYSWQNIWSLDKRLKLVTLFLLNGQPGPFSDFSLLENNKPNLVFRCWRKL